MLDLFNIAKPQGCDIQKFVGTSNSTQVNFSWTKPRGVSHVYMLLIGAGGDGDGTTGGGSGAVTVWYGAAQHVPDVLNILVGTTTIIRAKFSGSSFSNLLSANKASGPPGGTAEVANQFTASGFFQSVGGQAGSSAAPIADTSTFLGGGGGSGQICTGNYGYKSGGVSGGYFQTQPIVVGYGGNGLNASTAPGCGGGASGSVGGPGMVLIASW